MGPKQALPLRVRVDLEVMVIKEYFSFSKDPDLEPHHSMVLHHNQDTRSGRVLRLCRDTVGIFYCQIGMRVMPQFDIFKLNAEKYN